ncbi:hypothetical protein Ciccas_008621 [Cichlidogyrus casuarinus]|uniref:Uncharacterized protein n=1 Tax=Cichlidogyrus casuarinus TaxID=1844966 RepID=A0ABD2PZG4_9PLAT
MEDILLKRLPDGPHASIKLQHKEASKQHWIEQMIGSFFVEHFDEPGLTIHAAGMNLLLTGSIRIARQEKALWAARHDGFLPGSVLSSHEASGIDRQGKFESTDQMTFTRALDRQVGAIKDLRRHSLDMVRYSIDSSEGLVMSQTELGIRNITAPCKILVLSSEAIRKISKVNSIKFPMLCVEEFRASRSERANPHSGRASSIQPLA